MKPYISFIKIAALSICLFQTVKVQAQKLSGIIGRDHLIGYKADFLFQPLSPIHNLFIEKMVERRTNIGLSLFANTTNFKLDNNSIYIESYNNHRLSHQGKDRIVRDMDGTMTQSKKGFEIYIKRFSKRNKMRNFGLFWSYKFGKIRSVNTLKTGSLVYVEDTLNFSEKETLKVTSPGRYISTNNYVAFEIGRIVPFINDRMLLSYSFTYNGFYQGLKYTSMNETLENY